MMSPLRINEVSVYISCFNSFRSSISVSLQKNEDLEFKPLKTLSKYKLCSYHFEKCCFTNQLTKNRLTWDAIPTITTRMTSDDHLSNTQNGAGKHFRVINFEFNPLLTYALEIFLYFAGTHNIYEHL